MKDLLRNTVYVSWFSSVRETEADYAVTVQWLGLARLLTNPHKRRITTDENSVPLISFARFEGTRCNENVKQITAVLLTFNSNVKYETICRFASEYEFVAYSTHGHTAEKPNFTLILLPSRDIALAEWPRIQAAANAMFNNKADPVARDAAHIFHLPSAPATTRDVAFAYYNHGKLLDPDLLLSSNSVNCCLSVSSADFVQWQSPGFNRRKSEGRRGNKSVTARHIQQEL